MNSTFARINAEAVPAVRLTNLTKRYGQRTSVDHVSFTVPRGVVCGFIGQNGAGKTTTIRLLLGLINPTDGTAEVLGHSIDDPSAYLSKVGAMIEGPAFYPTLTARQNLRVLTQLGGIDESRIDSVLAKVDLIARADDQFRMFSLGMKQRLGIAAALLPNPELLILDEPTNGLDPQGIREVRSLLASLADDGLTVLVSSHLLDELQHVCEYVVLIDQGQLRFEGSIEQLLEMQEPSVVARPERQEDVGRVAMIARRAGYDAVVVDDAVRVGARLSFAPELNRACMEEGVTLMSLGLEATRLEDVFFSLTNEANLTAASFSDTLTTTPPPIVTPPLVGAA